MTIDERLEFLLHSTESLHASCQELHAIVNEHTRQMESQVAQAEIRAVKEDRLRRALLEGIQAFLQGLNGEGGEA